MRPSVDLEAMDRDGYLVVRGLLSAAEVAAVSAGFDRLLALARTLPGSAEVSGSRFVVDTDPFRLHRVVWCGGAEPSLEPLGADERFVSIAAAVLGARPVVQLIQQAHYKLPGDGVDFAWHQDASNRRYGSDAFMDVNGQGSFVQIAVAVDAMTRENGPLAMVPGSHRLGFVADPRTGELPGEVDLSGAVDVCLEPGDVAVFGPFVVHGSRPNRSDRGRRLFLQGYTLPGANRRVYPGCGTGVLRS